MRCLSFLLPFLLTSVTRKSMTIAFKAAGATRAALSLAAHSSREMVRSSGPPACVWIELYFLLKDASEMTSFSRLFFSLVEDLEAMISLFTVRERASVLLGQRDSALEGLIRRRKRATMKQKLFASIKKTSGRHRRRLMASKRKGKLVFPFASGLSFETLTPPRPMVV